MNVIYYGKELYHYGVKGQKWGERRYQNEDGSYTAEGIKRYGLDVQEKFRSGKVRTKDVSKKILAINNGSNRLKRDVGKRLKQEYKQQALENKNQYGGSEARSMNKELKKEMKNKREEERLAIDQERNENIQEGLANVNVSELKGVGYKRLALGLLVGIGSNSMSRAAAQVNDSTRAFVYSMISGFGFSKAREGMSDLHNAKSAEEAKNAKQYMDRIQQKK